MAVTPVPAFTPVPPFPPLSDRVLGIYNSKAYAFGVHMSTVFMTDLTGLASSALANAQEANLATTAAVSAAASAVTAASQAVAAANFKGVWPDLAGPLNKPACVKHNGRFWMLLNNLADVTTSQPGVSADWTSLNVGQVSTRINANTNAVAGVFYIATVPGITLSIPAGWTADDFVGGRNASGSGCFINWGAYTVSGETPEAPMSWPNRGRFNAVYDGSTFA
ncbi:hypothetical protein ACTJKQ_13400 [Acidovorax sp. 22279]|uniref:hypothetical protein n=1 Tax=Acidovorax sp. 22279 TaxID=3453900 RepID=UPI003F85288F